MRLCNSLADDTGIVYWFRNRSQFFRLAHKEKGIVNLGMKLETLVP